MPVINLIFCRYYRDRNDVRIEFYLAPLSMTKIAGRNEFDVVPTES